MIWNWKPFGYYDLSVSQAAKFWSHSTNKHVSAFSDDFEIMFLKAPIIPYVFSQIIVLKSQNTSTTHAQKRVHLCLEIHDEKRWDSISTRRDVNFFFKWPLWSLEPSQNISKLHVMWINWFKNQILPCRAIWAAGEPPA